MRARAARDLALGDRQRLPQFGERAAAEEAAEEQPVRFQGPARLHQRARQIVDGVQRQAGDGKIEAPRCEGLPLVVAHDRPPAARAARRRDGRHAGDLGLGQGRRQGGRHIGARCAEIEHAAEITFDDRQPLAQILGDAGRQEILPAFRERTGEAAADQRPVEDLRGSRSGFGCHPADMASTRGSVKGLRRPVSIPRR